ncbi:MAG: glycosyltransferase family 2 protein [Pseudomonadota bacterium]
MTTSDLPEISLIMPSWCSADYISAAVSSLQAQEDVSWELVVVDDASPDNTGDVVRSLMAHDPRIVLEVLPTNSGPAAARNRAIDVSKAPFIAVLDDDDTMEPRRLRTLIDIAESEGADIVIDNMFEVHEVPLGPIAGHFLDIDPDGPVSCISLADYLDPKVAAKYGASLGYLKPVFRRKSMSVRYDTTLRNSEDFYLVAELLALGARMVFTPTPFYRYTRRRGSLSWRMSAHNASAIVTAHERFDATYGGQMTAVERGASRRLLRQQRDQLVFARFVEALKARRIGKALLACLGKPASMPFVLSEIGRIVVEKISAFRGDSARRSRLSVE